MRRKVGPFEIEALGFGCMSLSHGYGVKPDDAYGERLLHRAIDLGHDFLDTASIYGVGHNETLLGRVLKTRRSEVTVASKCGIVFGDNGKRWIDCSPANIAATIDASLQRLGIDAIDLYYLHRRDFNVPIEDSVGALADAVQAGKIRSIGLSEMSADTIRRAAAVHPVAAVQTEYSPWTRNPEIAVLDACRELGITFVAFSPLARGLFTDTDLDLATLPPTDIRAGMPRFNSPAIEHNRALLATLREIAHDTDITTAQLCLAWVLAKGEHIVTIPGTAKIEHLEENWGARDIALDPATIARVDAAVNEKTVAGTRYAAPMQAQIDTEEFAI